jgi:membrane protein involved in colicin uptake
MSPAMLRCHMYVANYHDLIMANLPENYNGKCRVNIKLASNGLVTAISVRDALK